MAVFDSGNGTLEYTTQAILGTHDKELYSEVKGSKKDYLSAFGEIRDEISSWGGIFKRYSEKDEDDRSQLLKEFRTLTGSINSIPTVIESTNNKLLVPVNKLQSQVTTISTLLPVISTFLDDSRDSLNALVTISKENTELLNKMGQDRPVGGPEPIHDTNLGFIPDYTDAFSDISDILSSVRDNISGFDGNISVESIYPGFKNDLQDIGDAIQELADVNKTSTGFDVDNFTKDVQGLVTDLSESLVTSFTRTVVPEMGNQIEGFIQGFTENVSDVLENQGTYIVNGINNPPNPYNNPYNPSNNSDQPITLSGGVVDISGPEFKGFTDLVDQFHYDTVTLLQNIDERFENGVTTLNSSMNQMKSGFNKPSKGPDLGDVIDSFDDDTEGLGDLISSGSGILSNIYDAFKDYAADILAIFSWAHIKEHMNQLHTDATQIIQATGVNRAEALRLRSAVQSNIIGTYGMATTTVDERENALNDAIRAGMVSQQHLEQATEVSIAYNKLLGTSIDFSQGWAKSLMVTKTNADDYLESVALSIDEFSNKFFVSADKLQDAAAKYAASAAIFTTDFKGFSKAMNQAVQLQAAQEAANIQSMDVTEFMNRIAWTDLGSLTDQDYARLSQQFGIGGGELVKLRDELRNPATMNQAIARMMDTYQDTMSRDLARVQSGGTGAEQVISKNAQAFGMGPDELRNALREASDDSFSAVADILREDHSVADSEAATRIDAQTKVQQAANLTEIDALRNIAGAFEEGGVVKDIYNTLSAMGISGTLVGGVGALITGLIARPLISAVTKGQGLKGLFDVFSKTGEATVEAAGKGIAEVAGTAGKGVTTAAEAAAEAAGTSAGTAATTVAGKGATKAAEAAAEAAGKSASTAAEKSLSTTGKIFEFMKSPATTEVAEYTAAKGAKSVSGKAVGMLGTKLAAVLAVLDLVGDAGKGAAKAVELTGDDDYTSNLSAGVGGLFGGGEGGLVNAGTNALKWGAIGTLIAPGVGTAIGAVVGGILGGVGGDTITQGLDTVYNFVNDGVDDLSIFLEDNLGFVGHLISGYINSFKDIWIDIMGGQFKVLGDIIGGFQEAFEKVLAGDFSGALESVGQGFVDAGKDTVGMVTDLFTDVIDDWTLSAEERIAKRKGKLDDLTKDAEDAQKNVDSKIDGLSSDVIHTGESIFGELEGRKGLSDASGLNSFMYTDYGAEDVISKNKPIEHVPTTGKTASDFGISEVDLSDDLNTDKTANTQQIISDNAKVFGLSSEELKNSLQDTSGDKFKELFDATHDRYRLTNLQDEVNSGEPAEVKGPIIGNNTNSGSDHIAAPIVEAINNNIAPVISLLTQIAKSMDKNTQVDSRTKGGNAARVPATFQNKADVNSNNVLNYQNC